MTTLLVEVLTEELPPKALKRLGEAFAGAIEGGLRSRGFLGATSAVTPFASPRRLAVAIEDVLAVGPDRQFREKLLPVSIAFDAAGKPTPALLGKLRAKQLLHVDPAMLIRAADGKAEALFYADVAKGGPLVNALQSVLEEALAGLPIPKVMSYAGPGHYYNNEKFVRPAHRLLALHGTEVLAIRALGLEAGQVTAGHRFLSRADLKIDSAGAYEPTLEGSGKVIPSFAKRRSKIIVDLTASAAGATPIMPDALLDEVTALVECPAVYAGTFDAAFLAVPQECLVLTMQLNQKYFALADADGRLVNRFLLVSNIETQTPAAIIQGNERVLRARLADAKFFFDQDRKQPLAARVSRFEGIVYHNKLGTLAQRVQRLQALASRLAPLVGADIAQAQRAALLAKADLVTDMVGEFPELQGTMGRYYALHDGEAADVADAIAQHYAPRFAGDVLPVGPVAQAVALADKLEVLAGLFGIGAVPTGDKDPFGMRRAALGVIRILVEKRIAVPLGTVIDAAFAAFDGVPAVQDARAALTAFIIERLRGYLRDQGYSANEIASVVDASPSELYLVPEQLAAIKAFAMLPEAPALAAANKRIVNILRKNGHAVEFGKAAVAAVDPALLEPGAESELSHLFTALHAKVAQRCAAGDWTGALMALATSRDVVDRFFTDVMVMADDPAVRENRLRLLGNVAATMNRVADIGKLA